MKYDNLWLTFLLYQTVVRLAALLSAHEWSAYLNHYLLRSIDTRCTIAKLKRRANNYHSCGVDQPETPSRIWRRNSWTVWNKFVFFRILKWIEISLLLRHNKLPSYVTFRLSCSYLRPCSEGKPRSTRSKSPRRAAHREPSHPFRIWIKDQTTIIARFSVYVAAILNF